MVFPDELIRDFSNGIGSVFVGAGASIDAGLPGWAELLRKLTREPELPKDISYLDIAQYFENAHGRDELVTGIWELLQTDRDPTPIHEEIVRLPVNRIFTTNFDTLLESAALRNKRTPRKITNTDRSVTTSPNHLTIFKLHGDLDQRQSYVITSDDYEGYAATYPISVLMMSYELHTRTVLFVGYSFNDMDLRMIIKAVSSQAGRFGRQHYALLTNPSAEAEKELDRRKIRVIPIHCSAEQRGAAVSDWLGEFRKRVCSFNGATQCTQAVVEKRARHAKPGAFDPPAPTYRQFVGRDGETQRLVAALSSPGAPMLIVKGFPGSGKTSLALEAIRLVQTQQPAFDDVVWIPDRKTAIGEKEAAPAPRTVDDVVGAISLNLNGVPAGGDAAGSKSEARRLLGRRRILVVIDNLGPAEETELLQWAADVPAPSRVLITTRGLRKPQAGDNTIVLAGLDERAAGEFFASEAADLANADPALIRELVEVTGGNPQAMLLSIGIVRSKGMRFDELVQHLRSDTVSRSVHESLFDQLFSSSWRSLSEPARQMFVAAHLFESLASISCDALAAVADVPDYRAALGELRAANLLEDSEGRVAVHPLSRMFARAKYRELPLAVRTEMRSRQVRHYLDFASRYAVRKRPIELPPYWNALVNNSMASIDPEWPAIEETINWAIDSRCSEEVVRFVMLLVHYMDSRFLNQERRRYVIEATNTLQARGQTGEEALLRIDALGWTLIEDGQVEKAKEQINQGFQIARNLKNTDLMALAYAWLARIETQAGDSASANGLIQSALGMKTSPWIWYRVNFAAGDIAYAEDNCERALRFYQTAANQVEEYGGEEGYQIETRLGLAWAGLGYLDEAERNFNHIIGLARIAIGQLHAKYGLAVVAVKRGDHAKARRLLDEVRETLTTRAKSSLLLTMTDKLMCSTRDCER